MHQWRVWLLVGGPVFLAVSAGLAYSCRLWPASTVGVTIGVALTLVFSFTLAPGEKPWWMLPALGALAVLTFVALGVFLLTVCFRFSR